MGKKTNKVEEIDLLQLAKALWHWAWALILSMLVFGGAGFFYAYVLITPLYQSSALLYVNNSTLSVGNTSVSLSDLTASQSLVETYSVILKTRLTLNEVISRANLNYTYEELYEMVSAESMNGTEVFRVNVLSPIPEEAEVIANTITEVLPEKISEIMDGSSVRTVDYAVVPTRKHSPSITRYTALGMMFGLVLSAGIVILLDLLNDQIRDENYLLETYQLPVLAVIPDLLSTKPDKKNYYKYHYAAAEEKKK